MRRIIAKSRLPKLPAEREPFLEGRYFLLKQDTLNVLTQISNSREEPLYPCRLLQVAGNLSITRITGCVEYVLANNSSRKQQKPQWFSAPLEGWLPVADSYIDFSPVVDFVREPTLRCVPTLLSSLSTETCATASHRAKVPTTHPC